MRHYEYWKVLPPFLGESAILWKESPLRVRHDCTVHEVLASDKAS